MSENGIVIDVHPENEQVVLGALVNDQEAFARVIPKLDPELFNLDIHRDLVTALRELVKRGAEYAADSVVQLSGGTVKLKYLRDLEENYQSLPEANLKVHLEMLVSSAAKFSAVEDFSELYDAMDDPHTSAQETEDIALRVLRKIRDGNAAEKRLKRGKKLFMQWRDELMDLSSGKASNFVPTQFTALDDKLYEGLRPGRVIVVAGRPGMGKSTFCSNLTIRLEKAGRKVLSVPVEAGTESVVEQMACCLARVPAEKVIKKPDELTGEEMRRLQKKAREILESERIVFDDQMPNIDALEMTVEGEEFDVVILDLFEYLLQGDLDAAVVTAALRRVKKLAKRRGFAVIVVQQIRRIKRVKNPRPHLHELKNSGGYEEVADLVLLIHRDAYYDPDSGDEDVIEVKIAKQRRGPQNVTVGFKFHPDHCRIGAHTDDFEGKGAA